MKTTIMSFYKTTPPLIFLLLCIYVSNAQTYTLTSGQGQSGRAKDWFLLAKNDSFYFLRHFDHTFMQFRLNHELVKEEKIDFEVKLQKGYERSEIVIADDQPIRIDHLYNEKGKRFIINGTIMGPSKTANELFTARVKDKYNFVEGSIINNDKTFSVYTCYPDKDSVTFHFKTFNAAFVGINEWSYTLPYLEKSFTFLGNIGKNMIQQVYNIGNKKVCVVVNETVKQQGNENRLVAYVYDFSLGTVAITVLKDFSKTSAVKMMVQKELLMVFSEIHQDKKFIGVSYLVFNIKDNRKELEKETVFSAKESSTLTDSIRRTIDENLVPVNMHIGSSGNVYLIYEAQRSFNLITRTNAGGIIDNYSDQNMEYSFGDLFVFSLSGNGDLLDVKRIAKDQGSNDNYRFGSFQSLIHQNKLYIFLNDIGDRYKESTIKAAVSPFVLPEEGQFMGICITENGQISGKEISKTVTYDGYVIFGQDMIVLDHDQLLIPAEKGRNVNDKKQKLLVLTID